MELTPDEKEMIIESLTCRVNDLEDSAKRHLFDQTRLGKFFYTKTCEVIDKYHKLREKLNG